jgi:sulfite exporter TauE/SafE
MMAFGTATTPLLLAVTTLTGWTGSRRPRLLRLATPVALALTGLLLIWRGVMPGPVHASHGAHVHVGTAPPATGAR